MLPFIFYSFWQTVLISVFVLLLVLNFTRKSIRSSIDGPVGVPIFGYLPFMSPRPHENFLSLSKKYGNIFSIKLGSVESVVLNDWLSIKEALSKDEFTGRPETMFFNVFFPNKNLGTLEGPIWKEQRRFALKTLRDLGFAKVKMEEHIRDEILEFIELVDKENGKPEKLKKLIAGSILNIVSAFVTGKRFDHSDEHFHRILNVMAPDTNNSVVVVGAFVFFPAVSRFFSKHKILGFHKLSESSITLRQYVIKEVAEHKQTYDAGDIKDYIDAFLSEMSHSNSEKSSGFNDDILIGNTIGFFGAGIQTVTDCISWILLLLCYFPEQQKKIQEEIDSVIGNSRSPSYSDRNQMLLLQAFTLEAQRWTSFVPLNLPRKTLTDTFIQGKLIPKGTQVIANFYSVNIDENVWKNAKEFNPLRFISEDGKSLIKHDALLTFSYAFLLQKYDISNADGGKPSLESTSGAAIVPKFLNLRFTRREN